MRIKEIRWQDVAMYALRNWLKIMVLVISAGIVVSGYTFSCGDIVCAKNQIEVKR